MKNFNSFYFTIITLFILSCSGSENDNNCSDFVFGTGKTCNPEPNCIFKVTHGQDENNTQTETVDETTYNYYKELYDQSSQSQQKVCWKE